MDAAVEWGVMIAAVLYAFTVLGAAESIWIGYRSRDYRRVCMDIVILIGVSTVFAAAVLTLILS